MLRKPNPYVRKPYSMYSETVVFYKVVFDPVSWIFLFFNIPSPL